MSKLVMGARLYASLPEWPRWTTAKKVATSFDVTVRSAQRHLRKLEEADLAFSDWEPGSNATHAARWWRA